jgi:hypothetical protein
MKALVLAFLSLCPGVGVVAVTQSPANQALQKYQTPGNRLTTIMGTVRENDETLTFVTEQRTWNVDNPQILKGHEGHYIRVDAHVHPDTGSIHITKVKMPTANESRENDLR